MPFPDPQIPPPPDAPQDIAGALRLALDAAERFRGATAPNPAVGCCLLDAEGGVLALEAHRRAGEAHAEAAAVAAARAAGRAGRIHTAVVTLEPCDHHGRTPPCTEALLRAGVRRVVIGTPDPNPHVRGGGGARLVAAGLEVLPAAAVPGCAALAEACRRLLAPFSKRATTGRPYVVVKQALDPAGSMVPPPGARTFTSEPALRLAHALRRRADAILTGSGTVLADAPGFDVRRVPDHPGRRRQLAILDRRGRVGDGYMAAAAARGLDAFRCGEPGEALDRLGAGGANEVLVEAGPRVLASLAAAGLWDEWVEIRKGIGGAPDRAALRTRRGGDAEPLEIA